MKTSYRNKMGRGENPFVDSEIGEFDGIEYSLYELKFGLVFYTDYPPGPKRAKAVFDLYMRNYGSRIKIYTSTCPGADLENWVDGSLDLFHDQLLPNLRQRNDWGYGFDDGNVHNSYLFMFHGYRPAKEQGTASFFRFEFPWNVDQDEVKEFAADVARLVPFENGFGGYFFKPAITNPESYNKMYAVCRRFWGIEAWNLDVTVHYVLKGYKSVNWLTLIGNSLRLKETEAVKQAIKLAVCAEDLPNGVILQASEKALLGDRNYGESLSEYVAIAQALLPLQIKSFGSFGGERWNEENSLRWIKRFTSPSDFLA